MIQRSWRLAIVLSLLAAFGGGAAEAMYRCPHDRILRVVCCCPTAKAEPSGVALSRGRCCTVEPATQLGPTPAQVTTSDAPSPVAWTLVVSILPLPAHSASARSVEAHARAPDPPSLLVQKTSFLL